MKTALGAIVYVGLTKAAYYNASSDYASGGLGASPHQTFQSSTSTPVEWNFDVYPSSPPPPGYMFIAPRDTSVLAHGAYIFDNDGEMVWDGSSWGETMAFSVQTYQGKSVLALWKGAFNAGGYGNGKQILLDDMYQVVTNVSTTLVNQTNDFHEFQITTNDTALITIYAAEQYDLSSFNVTTTDGSQGWLLNCYFQEINIATGEAIFTWASLDHVDPSMGYAAPGSTGVSEDEPWDYFHMNSIEKDDAGNYLVSSRHCHAVYYISGSDGSILWTINGKNSSFSMADGSTFEWQHHARWRNGQSQMTIFDNGAADFESDETTARGLLLNIDLSSMAISLSQSFLPWNSSVSVSQGSVELESDGSYLIGWGAQPWFSTYSSDGTLLSAVQFGLPPDVQSYRAIRQNWTAYPTTSPNISVISNNSDSTLSDQYTVSVSWNGATEVGNWETVGWSSSSNTSLINVTKSGFETLANVGLGGYDGVYVVAYAGNGTKLGMSDVRMKNGTVVGNSTTSSGASSASPSASSAAATGTSGAGRSMVGGVNLVQWFVGGSMGLLGIFSFL
ncbi:hypothetical protein M231_06700 [Tremella mesenterica]|uniref:ASST-domain-containing protein n=1 Tax=Tremella mesenterica TaxID=5217 RepID=A0A4Q1BB74_TREME|nr:hypothetical protein M231_06700 [Tremella mesenterica]